MPAGIGYGNPGVNPANAGNPGPSSADALAILGNEEEAPQMGIQDEIAGAIAGLDENQQMQVLEFINSLTQEQQAPMEQASVEQPPAPQLGV